MGNYSDDTFDKSKQKHYVGVRLQQGVPLLDADWNEQEDIRKNELQSFLKSFIGNGVPKENGHNGFKIMALPGGGVNTIILNSKREEPGLSSITINLEASTAAQALGFTQNNVSVRRRGSSPARLTGNSAGPFSLKKNMRLVVETDGLAEEKITFKKGGDFSAAEVVDEINKQAANFSASVGEGNDFKIKGGDGTTDGAGRCLVGGWEVLNESDMNYTEQELYDNEDLANEWNVDKVEPLSPPASGERMDIIYLDVWEREVDSEEDTELFNPKVGTETCVRLKREWVVRVEEGEPKEEQPSPLVLPSPSEGHVFYQLATLHRKAKQDPINPEDITDFRRTGLAILSKEITISSYGNVGIGTTDPQEKLNLQDGNIQVGDNSSLHTKLSHNDLQFNSDSGEDPASYISQLGPGKLIFTTNGGPGNSRMTIDSVGRVGIGTIDPQNKLDVKGSATFDNPFPFSNEAISIIIKRAYLLIARELCISDTTIHSKIDKGESNKLDFSMQHETENKIVMSIILDKDRGKVGIGTITPENQLHVRGSATFEPIDDPYSRIVPLIIRGSTFAIWPKELCISDTTIHSKIINTNSNTLNVRMEHDSEDKIVMSIILDEDRRGKVGIGTTNPQAELNVLDGYIRIGSNTNVYTDLFSDRILLGCKPVESRDIAIGITGSGIMRDESSGKLHFLNGTSVFGYGLPTRIIIDKFGNVGIGKDPDEGFKLDVAGKCRSQDWVSSSSVYAEYFESADDSTIHEGTSVVLAKEGKIRPAKEGENPIGIIHSNSGVVGNSYTEWPKKYLRDEFGNMIMEDYQEEIMAVKKEKVVKKRQKVEKKSITEEVTRLEIVFKKGKYLQKEITETITRDVEEPLFEEVDLYDADGKKVIGKHRIPVMETYEEEKDVLDEKGQPVLVGSGEFVTKKRPKINAGYDESKKYILREDRPEWNCVGLLGQLPLRKGQPVAESWVKIKDISDEVELWLVK